MAHLNPVTVIPKTRSRTWSRLLALGRQRQPREPIPNQPPGPGKKVCFETAPPLLGKRQPAER